MSTTYILPCDCGVDHMVQTRQAGEMVSCICGRELEVPTLRGLAKLRHSGAAIEERRRWGPRQGLVFVGLVIAAVGFALAAYWFVTRPTFTLAGTDKVMENLTPADSLALWSVVRQGIDLGPTPDSFAYQAALSISWRRIYFALAVATCGLLVAASSLLIEPPKR